MGNEIYTTPPGSTLDSNSCDELCIDYERLDCRYWRFNKDEKQCTLYDSKDSECSFVSGPELPSIESCIGNKNILNINDFQINKSISLSMIQTNHASNIQKTLVPQL